MDALTLHRWHYHYIFPQLTMGLALLIVVLKTLASRTGNEHYNHSARFWAKIFGITFAMVVVTKPMDSEKTPLHGESLSTPPAALENCDQLVLSWSSWDRGFPGSSLLPPIAWMQHPVGYTLGPNGEILLRTSMRAFAAICNRFTIQAPPSLPQSTAW